MDEREDEALFKSLQDSARASGDDEPEASAPQELAAEHEALLKSLSALRQENPEGEKSLLGHFDALIQAVRAVPNMRAQESPQAPPDAPRGESTDIPHDAGSSPEARYLEPSRDTRADSLPEPPYVETSVDVPEPLPSGDRVPGVSGPDIPQRSEGSQDPLDNYVRRKRAQWEAEAYPVGRKPAVNQGDLVEDPGWDHPPSMEAHMPQMTNEMGTSLRSMEMMFRRMVEMFNEHSRAINEMQATLMRNGIF